MQSLVNNNQLSSGIPLSVFVDSVSQFIQKWRKQINGLRPIDMSNRTHQMLFDLQKMVSDEKAKFDINIGSSIINLDIDTKSQQEKLDIDTKSINPAQLELLDLKASEVTQCVIKPLTATELSKRFNKPDGFVRKKKYELKGKENDFYVLLKENDPQNIGWQYSENDKKYHPIFEN
jgi:hypothetical protein